MYIAFLPLIIQSVGCDTNVQQCLLHLNSNTKHSSCKVQLQHILLLYQLALLSLIGITHSS
ncbi:hypothetical protein D9603_19915 [Pseudoalteromonas sp. PS5]|nr:hypothetical protein D9603_19915 [Pseudoalteromonas sp. PS5]